MVFNQSTTVESIVEFRLKVFACDRKTTFSRHD